MAREFPTEVIVSAATGMLLAEFSPVHEFYTYMAGEPVFTHQIPRLAREVKPALLERHPELAPTCQEAEEITQENWQQYRDRFIERHGAMMTVEPLKAAEHESIDPLSELAEMVHPDRIVVVKS
jgi:hypothetical protein